MELIDLERQYQYREENMQIENRNKMQEILKYFFYLCKTNNISYQNTNSLWENFILNYRTLSEKGFKNDINLYMKSIGAKENAFIYELLHNIETDENLKSLITENEQNSLLTIGNKNIEFTKADKYFINTELENYFKEKKLAGECFDRTLELSSYLKDSKAIVSYLPNLFAGGYYHAYIMTTNKVLIDPASNLVLLNDDAKELLSGQIVFSMDYEEIKSALNNLESIENIEEYDRPTLLKLALFTECNMTMTEEIESKNRIGR